MISRIEPERVRQLNDLPVRHADYVIYWMNSSQRTQDNPALIFAIERSDQFNLPLIVYFGLWPSYPEANLRHFRFMLEGLAEVGKSLESLGIRFVLRIEPPDKGVLSLAKHAALVVTDRGYLKQQQSWYQAVADQCPCMLVQVEGNVVVPVEVASGKEEYSAGIFRPKVLYHADRFLHDAETKGPEISSLSIDLDTRSDESPGNILSGLSIDHSVPASEMYKGGTTEANERFDKFIRERLEGYADYHNDPGKEDGSGMSPYLHFGQVSPVTLVIRAQGHGGKGCDAFLEQLVVRRELAINFVRYNANYDTFMSLPAWVQKTLRLHRDDIREFGYSLDEIEGAKTHDQYWNAAQREMVKTGKMHGYMRMYWGKKIIEWSKTPEGAYKTALYLNNKYQIDGRDPNGYAGIAWCFGKHDRPWGERPVFGMVRYMNAQGLRRKFSMDRYISKVAELG